MTNPRIPILDLTPGIESQRAEINAALQRVVDSGHFILGEEVEQFEKEAARFLGVKHAIGVNSGTDALLIALRALGIRPNDEVITSSFSFFATAEAISLIGARPVFVDIDPTTFNLDAKEVRAKINAQTRAIIPVHLFGLPCDMEEFAALSRKYQVKLVEDVAQAFGARFKEKCVGAWGDMGAFSFFPSKNLGAFGDAGLITTHDETLAEKVRMLRVHGSKQRYANEVLGYNSRLDALQAAILRVRLTKVDEWNRKRAEAANRYSELLGGTRDIVVPSIASGRSHVYHQYTLRIQNGKRDQVAKSLDANGISTMIYYPTPIHKLPVYKHLAYRLPVTEQMASEVLSLPIWPEISEEVQLRVVAAIKSAV